MNHKAGFVNIIGNPNVGKSTLMNAFIGEKLSIITSKAQTTRHRILGIVNGDDFQVVLSDTPGIIKPAYELQESMMGFVKSAFEDADILIYMVEIGEENLKDEAFFKKITSSKIPVLLLLNKIDKSDQEQLETQVQLWAKKVSNAEIFPVSALEGFNVKEIFSRIIELLPESPPFYPKEIIRIRSVIMVERETQKGIIIGHKGSALKRVGVEARKDLETFFGKQIHLELYVKVNKNWRSNQKQLRRFGYNK